MAEPILGKVTGPTCRAVLSESTPFTRVSGPRTLVRRLPQRTKREIIRARLSSRTFWMRLPTLGKTLVIQGPAHSYQLGNTFLILGGRIAGRDDGTPLETKYTYSSDTLQQLSEEQLTERCPVDCSSDLPEVLGAQRAPGRVLLVSTPQQSLPPQSGEEE